MNVLSMAGLLIFLFGAIAYRAIMTRALDQLDDEMKLRVIKVFPRRNLYAAVVLTGFLIAYLSLTFLFPCAWFFTFIGFLLVFALCLVALFVLNYKRLRELSVTANYLKSFVSAAVLVVVVWLMMGATVLYSVIRFYRW